MQSNATLSQGSNGFGQMAAGMKSAFSDFKSTPTPESLLALATTLSPFARYAPRGFKLLRKAARRHPVAMGLTAAAAGYAAYRWMKKNDLSLADLAKYRG